jgi:hypothetical protein
MRDLETLKFVRRLGLLSHHIHYRINQLSAWQLHQYRSRGKMDKQHSSPAS